MNAKFAAVKTFCKNHPVITSATTAVVVTVVSLAAASALETHLLNMEPPTE